MWCIRWHVNTCVCSESAGACPRLFSTKPDQQYSSTKDLLWKFNRPPRTKALKVIQVGRKWQSNHYKVKMKSGHGGGQTQGKKSWFLLRQTGSLALSEGVPVGGWGFRILISVRVSEAMKCGAKPQPWGRAQMVEWSQSCRAHFKRGQVAFSSLLKALGKTDAMHKGQALCWLTDTIGWG